MRVLASAGHALAHAPHAMHSLRSSIPMPIPFGHTATQAPHPMHLLLYHPTSSFCSNPSGFEHHLQRSGQPAMNIFDRIPSPSFTEKGWICIIYPFTLIITIMPGAEAGLFVCYQNASCAFLAIIESCISFERLVNCALYPATLTSRLRYLSGFACASASTSLEMVLNCTWKPPRAK